MSLLLLFGGAGQPNIICATALVFIVTGTDETIGIVTGAAGILTRVTIAAETLAAVTGAVDGVGLVTTATATITECD